ncbi:MAG TPA: acyl-CoA dehydrogenase family protein, partial [Lacibacter sp.]|nr:acyl-CoA dehydrogenase family protein [Lacibacter sp.]
MDFKQSEITDQVAQVAKDFAHKHIKPHVMEWDETQHFPKDVLQEMGKLGLMGIFVPEKYGGSGFGYYEYVAVIVETAKVCGSVGLSLAAHNSLCTGHILYCGSEEQKNKYLPKLSSGELIGDWG